MNTEELNDSIDRIQETQSERVVLGVRIRERILPVAPGRNLAVLVEAAVRNHILTRTGYDAAADLVSQHTEQLERG